MIDKSIVKHGGLLAAFALVATGLVAGTHHLTKNRIADQIQAQRLSLLNTVIPAEYHDNDLTQACVAVDAPELGGPQTIYVASLEGIPRALAIETTAKDGYSGDINMIVGVSLDATVLGVRVLNHKETPGLGDKVELSVSDWILSFDGKSLSEKTSPTWKVKKDGGQFDQFTGATITPRAVVNTVARTISWAQDNQAQLLTNTQACGA